MPVDTRWPGLHSVDAPRSSDRITVERAAERRKDVHSRQCAVTKNSRGVYLMPGVVMHWHEGGVGMTIDQDTIRQLAQAIWETEGKPDGQEERHWDMATRLAESAAMAPARSGNKHRIDTLFPEPDESGSS